MKLSELSTERAADVLCELAPHVINITSDKTLIDTLQEKLGTGEKSIAEMYTYAAKKVSAIVPIVLKEHRNDVFSILSILNETSVDEIAKQNVLVTISQVKDIFSDKELMDFFKSWR